MRIAKVKKAKLAQSKTYLSIWVFFISTTGLFAVSKALLIV